MQIRPNAEKIRRWREERYWSQEHLAELAGIGLRTVQRIENGDGASRESLMALAAAFDVDVTALSVDVEREAIETVQNETLRKAAGLRLSFLIHLVSYVFGMIVFAGISLGVGGDTYAMLWPSIWWTVGLAGHAVPVLIVEVVTRHQRLFVPSK